MSGAESDCSDAVSSALIAWLDVHQEAVLCAIGAAVGARIEARFDRFCDGVAEEVAAEFVRKHGDWIGDRLTWSDVRMDIADQIAAKANLGDLPAPG